MTESANIDIAKLIPHQGDMCLLASVEHWDASGIRCKATSHRDPANPLRTDGVLGAMALVEYGAQAAAIHASLAATDLAGDRRVALIGAIKALTLHVDRVEPDDVDLEVCAQSEYQTADGAIYQVTVSARQQPLMEARVVLLLPDG